MGRHTREFQRRWAAAYPAVELHLIHTNSATGGLAEGLCDIAVLRTPVDGNRFASAIVGHERRYCALAADDPWARRRFIRLDEIPQRTLLIDRRTGSTTPDLWPAARGRRPARRPTSMIGCRSSPPAAASGSPPRAPRPSTGATVSSSGRYARPAHRRADDLAAARPASLDPCRHRPADRAVPPSVLTGSPSVRLAHDGSFSACSGWSSRWCPAASSRRSSGERSAAR